MLLNEQQQLLKTTIEDLMREQSPISSLRKLRDSKDETGYSQQLWQQFVDIGIPAAALPEQKGGYGFGYLGLGAIFEVMGRHLCASPLFSTMVLGASALELGSASCLESDGANNPTTAQLLTEVIEGQITLALAIDEGHRHQPKIIEFEAKPVKNQWQLTGSKNFVLDGHSADKIIVVTRTAPACEHDAMSGLTLFVVDAKTPSLSIQRTHLMDNRNAANLHFDAVSVDSNAIIGELDNGWSILQTILDRGRICLAAEMLGGASAVFEQTMAYLREREQFDVKIGSFQALKHRSAQMLCDLELCRSAVLEALSALDNDVDNTANNENDKSKVSLLACLAKTLANDVYQKVTNEAVQLHGGMGVTDELDVGLFLKRARVSMQILGDSHYLQDRYASLLNY